MRPQGNIIGPQVARLRNAQGLSQAALAAKCQRLGFDISREVLARIETRVRCVTDTELVILARVLAVQIESLLPAAAVESLFASRERRRRKSSRDRAVES
jgi:transcriptional regulator with XRE-family HTH domain